MEQIIAKLDQPGKGAISTERISLAIKGKT